MAVSVAFDIHHFNGFLRIISALLKERATVIPNKKYSGKIQ